MDLLQIQSKHPRVLDVGVNYNELPHLYVLKVEQEEID